MASTQTTRGTASGWNALADDFRNWLTRHVFAIVVTGVFVLANISRWVWMALHRPDRASSGLSLSFVEALTPHRPGVPGPGNGVRTRGLLQQFEHLVESLFFVKTPFMLIFCALVTLLAVGFAESRTGVVRTAALIAVNAFFGTALGLLVCVAINSQQADWSWLERLNVTLSPLTMAIGIAMACSAYESVMWRRRIILIVYAFTATALLFSGSPGDYCTLAIAIIGHVAGNLMHRHDMRQRDAKASAVMRAAGSMVADDVAAAEALDSAASEDAISDTTAASASDSTTAHTTMASSPSVDDFSSRGEQPDAMRRETRTHWWPGTDYETRRLFATVQMVFAIGPIISMTSRAHAGLLTGMGLFLSPDINADALLNSCERNHLTTSCPVLAGVHRVAMLGLWTRILLPVVAMLIVAWGLYHGRRLAALVCILFNTLSTLFAIADYLVFPLSMDITPGIEPRHFALTIAFLLTAAPPLILAISLTSSLSHFEVRAPSRPLLRGMAAIVTMSLLTGLTFVVFGMSRAEAFTPRATPGSLLLDFLHRLLPVGFAGRLRGSLHPDTELTSAICWLIITAMWVTVLVVFYFWFRDRLEEGQRGRERADRLVETDGESMSFMTTWEGNRYWFSPSGRCGIAYRVSHGVALTVTGPFGDPEEYDSALPDFMRFCYAHSLSPAFYAVHERTREQLERLGCSSIHVGTEMVVIPKDWQTRGKKWQDIRTAINKAKRVGITDVLTTFDQAGWKVQQQIIDISEQWASLKALPEMKFTLGGLEELRDPRVAVLYAVDEDGLVQGVTSWMPTYRGGRIIGWTLDFMRHRTDSPNGIMEFLIARMAERLRDEGEADPAHAVEFMSLSAAPLAGMGQDAHGTADAEVIEHALQIVADYIEPAYGFKSLYFFKRKFQPQTDPVYMCYLDSAKLAQIGLAVLSSYVPELKASQVVEMLKTIHS